MLTPALPQLQTPCCKKKAVTVFPKPASLSAPWHPACWRRSQSHLLPHEYQSRTSSSRPQYQTEPEHHEYQWCNMHLRGPVTQKQNNPVSCKRWWHHSYFETLLLSREGKSLKGSGVPFLCTFYEVNFPCPKMLWRKESISNLISSQRNMGTVLFLFLDQFQCFW